MKMMLLLILSTACFISVKAQTIGEFKPKVAKSGMRVARTIKDIYISNFKVNYQIYAEKEVFKQDEYQLADGHKGNVKTSTSVGLSGLTEADVQQITDRLYADFISQINAKGLSVLDAEQASKIESYSDYRRLEGGKVQLEPIPGLMSSSPTGFQFFMRKVNEDGKAKRGGFSGRPAKFYPRLSKELGDAIIADVNIFVLFVKDRNSLDADANLKSEINLRIAAHDRIPLRGEKSPVKFRNKNIAAVMNSTVNFAYGSGLGAATSYSGQLAKGIAIEDVIEDEKVTSFTRGGKDMTGVKTMYATYFRTEDRTSEARKIVNVNSKKYIDGVYGAAKKFMDYHTNEFLSGMK